MENKEIIECPNCKKRIFADSRECAYCKYIIKEKENNFDKDIYNFLYCTYEKNRNKPETIKIGMEKYRITMKEAKDIVDYASELIYNKEQAKQNIIPKEELPTNEEDYSKIRYTKRGTFTPIGIARHKNFPIRVIGIILYFAIILILLFNTKNMQNVLFGAFIVGVIAIWAIVVDERNIPPTQHTFVFSFWQYFIHKSIYQIVILILAISWLYYFKNNIYSYQNSNEVLFMLIYIVGIVVLFLRFTCKFAESIRSQFLVERENIRYEYEKLDWFLRKRHWAEKTFVEYEVKSINKIQETLNSLIIYGNIEKKIVWMRRTRIESSNVKKIEKLKVPKIFKNNKNLIKAIRVARNVK